MFASPARHAGRHIRRATARCRSSLEGCVPPAQARRKSTLSATSAAEAAGELSLCDTKNVYAHLSTPELLRRLAIFAVCGIKAVSANADALIALSKGLLGRALTDAVVRRTFFAHFCAGEDAEAIKPTVRRLEAAGIGGILDYAAEADVPVGGGTTPEAGELLRIKIADQARVYTYESEAQCDAHEKIFRACIDAVHETAPGGFAAIKLTALGNPLLLERMSACIVELRALFDKFDIDGDGTITEQEFSEAYDQYFTTLETDCGAVPFSKAALLEEMPIRGAGVDYLAWTKSLRLEDLPMLTERCRDRGPLYGAVLRGEEAKLMGALRRRIENLAAHAQEKGVRLMVDAEQTYFQPAIDNCVVDLQRRFNREEPVVFNTYQCYLRDAERRLADDLRGADVEGYKFAAKLVRGAYMVTERRRASDLGLPDPVHATIEDTHRCYDASVARVLDAIAGGRGAEVMVATHNQVSVEAAVRGMRDRGLPAGADSGVYFGQLLGMADHLSYGLGGAGHAVLKYLPFGPVGEVMPYLIRRAQENSGLLGGVGKEAELIRRELLRRAAALW